MEIGHEVTLRVLDVNKANGIVELTAKEELLLASQQEKKSKKGEKAKKKKGKAPALPQASFLVKTVAVFGLIVIYLSKSEI